MSEGYGHWEEKLSAEFYRVGELLNKLEDKPGNNWWGIQKDHKAALTALESKDELQMMYWYNRLAQIQ